MWKVLCILMFTFMFESPGYDFPMAPQKVPQETPKGYRDTAIVVLIDELK